MDDNHGESIEFQEINGDFHLTDLVRSSFRIPTAARKNYFITINDLFHPLVDISNRGVALEFSGETNLMMNDIISGCRLILEDEIVENLKGQVVHLSPGRQMRWICGICWVEPSMVAARKIGLIVDSLRKELFEDSGDPNE